MKESMEQRDAKLRLEFTVYCIEIVATRLGCPKRETYRRLDLFHNSNTSEHLHNEATGLYLMGDLFIVDELMRELQDKQG